MRQRREFLKRASATVAALSTVSLGSSAKAQAPSDKLRIACVGVGEKGKVFVNRGGVYGKPVDELKENPLPEDAWRAPHRAPLNSKQDSTAFHVENFFECVRSRKEPIASAAVEHRSITACHLTNISIRLGGHKLQWDPVKEEIVNDAEAKAMQSRKQREPYAIS